MSEETPKFNSLAEAEEALANERAESAALLAANDEKVAELQSALDAAQADLAVKAEAATELQAALSEAEAEIEALNKDAEDAEAELTELRAKDMDADRRAASIAAASGSSEPLDLPQAPTGNEATRAEFEAMSFRDRSDFLARGGKIVAG